jgi:hypothetical protein
MNLFHAYYKADYQKEAQPATKSGYRRQPLRLPIVSLVPSVFPYVRQDTRYLFMRGFDVTTYI